MEPKEDENKPRKKKAKPRFIFNEKIVFDEWPIKIFIFFYFRPRPLDILTPEECILRLLIRGVQDKSASIRARALQCLQPLLEEYEMCQKLTEVARKIVSLYIISFLL